MKKIVFLLFINYLLLVSCTNSVIEKPDNLIDQDEMIEIIYDISLLDAMKANDMTNQNNYPSTKEFLKKKYKIDSVTFAKNNQYYASNIRNYKKMFEKVKEKMEATNNEVIKNKYNPKK